MNSLELSAEIFSYGIEVVTKMFDLGLQLHDDALAAQLDSRRQVGDDLPIHAILDRVAQLGLVGRTAAGGEDADSEQYSAEGCGGKTAGPRGVC